MVHGLGIQTYNHTMFNLTRCTHAHVAHTSYASDDSEFIVVYKILFKTIRHRNFGDMLGKYMVFVMLCEFVAML